MCLDGVQSVGWHWHRGTLAIYSRVKCFTKCIAWCLSCSLSASFAHAGRHGLSAYSRTDISWTAVVSCPRRCTANDSVSLSSAIFGASNVDQKLDCRFAPSYRDSKIITMRMRLRPISFWGLVVTGTPLSLHLLHLGRSRVQRIFRLLINPKLATMRAVSKRALYAVVPAIAACCNAPIGCAGRHGRCSALTDVPIRRGAARAVLMVWGMGNKDTMRYS